MRVQFGEITFDADTREVTRGGDVLHLSPKAFQLLQILIERRPNAVPKQELIELVWPDVVVEEANLKNLIGEIRAALGQPGPIRTIRRFGYAFAAPAISGGSTPIGKLSSKDHVYSLIPGENIVGRSEECAICLNVPGVSRRHARIVSSESGDATLEDLDSKNGTWVNGIELSETTPLKPGDEIGIGVAVLTYHLASKDETTVTVEAARRHAPSKAKD